jgi:4-methyl-5(b-hydroxyethyl)-thiazole monophosphate biosynthesis
MVYLFLANGFEEVEALTPVDVLRRAGIEMKTVSINKGVEVEGKSHITVHADCTIDDVDTKTFDMLILPGGQPGTTNLDNCQKLHDMLKYAVDNKKWIAAICAAPTILGKKGYLKDKEAVCYPGCEVDLQGAVAGRNTVAKADNFITSKGPGTALDFSYAIVAALRGEKLANEIKSDMVYGC